MSILNSIVEQKKGEVAARKRERRLPALMESEHFHRKPLSLLSGLRERGQFSVIAEIKRSSPSAGSLRSGVDPAEIARTYESAGASGISVLTDEHFFAGSLEDLRIVRDAVRLPVLRKDFIIDEYQIVEAKASGADAVLLIAGILDRSHLADLFAAAEDLGIECLVELYETAEIDILDFDIMKLIGVNNRDLRTFKVDLGHSIRVKQLLPHDITLVSESGIRSADDIRRLHAAGIRAALIGEHLMTSSSPGDTLAELLQSVDHEAKS